MSVMHSQKLLPLQFYRSSAAPCPYLPGRIERKLFARLSGPEAPELNSVLSHAGFRRSHDIIYRPACPGCSACVPVRIPVQTFAPQGSLARILRRGAALQQNAVPASPSKEQYDLFIAYEAQRHAESDMARMTYEDYCAMLTEGDAQTQALELRTPDGQLTGVMLADPLADGWSAVYSFYDPSATRYSLGTLLIMRLVEHARSHNSPYVYLGYWVGQSRKMSYKSRFAPLEKLTAHGWAPFLASEQET